MRTPRRLLGEPVSAMFDANTMPGYLCELCQDAPAVLIQPTPDGGERVMCSACSAEPVDEGMPEVSHSRDKGST
jgi:hypothetical protein